MDELLQFVKDVHWDRMGAFTYSPEEEYAWLQHETCV